MSRNPATALLSFHLRSSVRLALRAGVPAVALLTVAVGLSADPGATLRVSAADLASAAGVPSVALVLVVVSAGISAWAAPRIGHGIGGWIRHLPVATATHARGLLGALVVAQSPVAVLWTGLWLAAWSFGPQVDARRLIALPVVLAGVALAFLPGRRRPLLATFGFLAILLVLAGGWSGLVFGALLVPGGLLLFEPRPLGGPHGLLWHTTTRGRLLPELIAQRAIGWRELEICALLVLALAVGFLIVHNNPRLDPGRGLRLVGGLAVTLAVVTLAVNLGQRRPPWRWARSLPWSAADRVRHDSLWLAAHAGAVPLIFGVALDAEAGVAIALIVPLVSVRAAALLRGRRPVAGAYARVLEGALLSLALALSAWVALAAVLLTWPAWLDAARRDRDLDVSRWAPHERLAVGDPSSWSGE